MEQGQEGLAEASQTEIKFQPKKELQSMPKVQTVEQTSKGWKGLILLSGLACLVAGGMFAVSMQTHDSQLSAGAVFLMLFGLPTWLFARIGAWWCHG
jgi:hypothetical protein